MSLSDEPGSNKCQVRSGVVAHGCTWSQSRPLVTPDDFLGIYIHPTRFRKGAAQKVQKFNSWTFGVVSSKITMRCDSQGVYKGFSNINHLFWGSLFFGKHPWMMTEWGQHQKTSKPRLRRKIDSITEQDVTITNFMIHDKLHYILWFVHISNLNEPE